MQEIAWQWLLLNELREALLKSMEGGPLGNLLKDREWLNPGSQTQMHRDKLKYRHEV